MVAGADLQPGFPADDAKVFYHDGDLRVEIEVSPDVEQVACDDDQVVKFSLRHDPVELGQAKMQVRNGEDLHGGGSWA